MTRRRTLIVLATTLGLAATALVAWLLLRPVPARGGEVPAERLTQAWVAALDTAETLREAHRCARLRADDVHRLELGGKRLVLGVVADAGGADAATLRRLRQVRAAFAEAGVELVISLGGMASSREDLITVLGAVAGDWPLIAIPGDRESITAHRAALAALRDEGHEVYDGARIRLYETAGPVLATVPGAQRAEHLLAGVEGCVYEPPDLRALAGRLAAYEQPLLVAAHVPPRQRGDGGTDVAPGAVHIGDPVLAEALLAGGAELVLHGQVVPEQAAGTRTASAPGPVAAGAVDPLAAPLAGNPAVAAIVMIDGGKIRWRHISATELPAGGH